METSTISTFNVEKNRIPMAVYGDLFGKEVYSVKAINADPKYNERKNRGELVPIRPIKIFMATRHNIVGVRADVDGSGMPIVIMTDTTGVEIRGQISKPELREPSVASVKEALEAFESAGETIFFTDCAKLTSEINQLNSQQRICANDYAKEMAAQSTMLQETIENMRELQRRYYDSLNANDSTDRTATVQVSMQR